MKAIPKRTFLLRQEIGDGGVKKDIIARKGEKIEVTEKEAVRFFGSFDLDDKEKKRLTMVAKQQKYTRLV